MRRKRHQREAGVVVAHVRSRKTVACHSGAEFAHAGVSCQRAGRAAISAEAALANNVFDFPEPDWRLWGLPFAALLSVCGDWQRSFAERQSAIPAGWRMIHDVNNFAPVF